MKKMTILIPVMNGMRFAMPMLGALKYNTSPDTEWLVVDNGSTEPVEAYIRNYIKPKKLNFIRNETNIGLMETNKLAYEYCKENGSDILMLLHTDCFIFEKDWDKRIMSYFEKIPKLGIAGLFGAQGCMPNGGRLQDVEFAGQMSGMSNMLEAEIHGMRMKTPWRSCAIFDSFAMCLSMEMLKAGGGFDMRYELHHMYDRDTSLESLRRGYKNIVVDIPCHHIGGLTGESPQYQEWLEKRTGSKFEDGKIHNANTELFIEKWKDVLPLYVNDDFSFREGVLPFWTEENLQYKGDIITKMKGGEDNMQDDTVVNENTAEDQVGETVVPEVVNEEVAEQPVEQTVEEVVPGGTEVVEETTPEVETPVVEETVETTPEVEVVDTPVTESINVPTQPLENQNTEPGRASMGERNTDGTEKV